MRPGEIWFQAQRDPELRNAFRDVLLRQENPTEKIVSLGVAGCELYHLFECSASVREIAVSQSRQTPAIRHLGSGKTVLRLRDSEICTRDNERRQHY
jgi:hypothetical protein